MRLMRLPYAPTSATTRNIMYGIVYMCLSCFFWAAIELTGFFIPEGYNALQTVWVRYGFHLVFMLIVFGPSQGINLVRTQVLKLQLFRPLLMIGMPVFFLLGISFMPHQNVWAIFWTAPIMVLVLATLILKERVTSSYWLLTTVGILGVLAIYQPRLQLLTNWTIIFPLAMAFCFSFYVILTRALRAESTVTNLFYTALIVFLPWSIGLPYFWQSMNIMALITMCLIGFLGFWALYFLDKAYELTPVSVLAPLLYSQPTFSVLLSFLLFRQPPGFFRLAGSAGLISMGTLVIFMEKLRVRVNSNNDSIDGVSGNIQQPSSEQGIIK